MKVGFIGLGKLGLPSAQLFVEKGHQLDGYDVNTIDNSNINIVSSIEEVVLHKDIVFIAVPTPHQDGYDGSKPTHNLEAKDFMYKTLTKVVEQADSFMTNKQLLVVISTVLPGVIRNNIFPKIKNAKLVYNPYLIAMTSVKQDLIDPEMIIVGTIDGNNKGYDDILKLQKFYNSICNEGYRLVTGTWEEAECIKIFYNTFLSTKLALVNMIQDVAQKINHSNTDIITQALADSSKRITSSKYMKAGLGDGGPCHPRDNIALRYLAQKLNLGYDLFDMINFSRDMQAKNLANAILKEGRRVQFSSDYYKTGTQITDGSYSLLVQYYVNALGGVIVDSKPDVFVIVHEGDSVPDDVKVFDPWRTYVGKNTCVYYGKTR